MRMRILAFSMLVGLAVLPAIAEADVTIVDEPEIRGWALEQTGPVVNYEKDVVIGDFIPETIELAPVPRFERYGYVILNTERVIVDRESRQVLAVY